MSRTAIVTGVGSGLGAALVRKLVQENCRVGMFARSKTTLTQLAAELGEKVLAIPTDITQPNQVSSGFKKVREVFGPIDILINHAGNATWAGLTDLTPDQFEQAWRVGPYGSFLCCQEAAADMLKQEEGTILFSGATSLIRERGGALAFSSAKFGVRGLAESLARELWPKGIHVAHVIIDGEIGSSSKNSTPMSLPSILKPWPNRIGISSPRTEVHGQWNLTSDLIKRLFSSRRPHEKLEMTHKRQGGFATLPSF